MLTRFGLPWRFGEESSEKAYQAVRVVEWAAGPDQWVAFPWSLLWVTIIARHWSSLSWYAIARSSVHFTITIGPAYLARILGKQRYHKYRNLIVAAAIISYTLHPGGGLYRDAIMINKAEHTGLDAINLFVRLLIGSRTLFWMLLVFGYELPPEIGVPLNAACLLIMGRLRPSQPFCSTMQTAATRALFHAIAASLPLISTISIAPPLLAPNADICNPLVHWLQATLSFLLPTYVHLCREYEARLEFARRYPRQLTSRDQAAWQRRLDSAFSPWPLAAMLFVSSATLLWYALTW